MPVFSFEKIRGADISLGPEMKSTGECLGISKSFDEALYKAFEGAGIRLPKHKQIIMTLADKDKQDGIDIAQRLKHLDTRYMLQEVQLRFLKKMAYTLFRLIRLDRKLQHSLTLY